MPLKMISFEEAFTTLRKLTSVKTLAADFSESISLETKCYKLGELQIHKIKRH